MTPKSPITDQQRIEWAQLAHVSYLHALMNQSTWRVGQIAFHGGTSLHLSWHSPRHSEDLDFFKHHGFDWGSIWDALLLNIQHKRIIKGGSGITQQLAKNSELRKVRRDIARVRTLLTEKKAA